MLRTVEQGQVHQQEGCSRLRCACRFGSYFDGPKDIYHAAYLEEAFGMVRYIDDETYKAIACEYKNM